MSDHEQARDADARLATPGKRKAVGARPVTGRFFDSGDDENSRKVVIVDELLARQAWPDKSALGQEINVLYWTGSGFAPDWAEVVGVVGHIRHHELTQEVRGQVFEPFAQGPRNQVGVAVRTPSDPMSLVGPVRDQVSRIDPELAFSNLQPMEDLVARAKAGPRFRTALAGVLAVLALVLACVGLYGVLSFSVARRNREIGIRLAFGGKPGDIVRLFLGQGLRLLITGVAIGVPAALAVNRLLKSLLFEVAPSDPVTMLVTPGLLIVVALTACYFPARRAARIDPVRSLRCE